MFDKGWEWNVGRRFALEDTTFI